MDELLSQSSGSQRAALSLLPPRKCGNLYRYVFLRLSQNGFKLVSSSFLPINLNLKKNLCISSIIDVCLYAWLCRGFRLAQRLEGSKDMCGQRAAIC